MLYDIKDIKLFAIWNVAREAIIIGDIALDCIIGNERPNSNMLLESISTGKCDKEAKPSLSSSLARRKWKAVRWPHVNPCIK